MELSVWYLRCSFLIFRLVWTGLRVYLSGAGHYHHYFFSVFEGAGDLDVSGRDSPDHRGAGGFGVES